MRPAGKDVPPGEDLFHIVVVLLALVLLAMILSDHLQEDDSRRARLASCAEVKP